MTWKTKKLGELGEIITGKTPSTKQDEFWGGDIQFVTPTDMIEDSITQELTERTVTRDAVSKTLPKGTVIFSCIASIGKVAITKYEAVTNQQINSIVVADGFNNKFVYYALLYRAPMIKSDYSGTTTVPIINKSDFSNIKITIPQLAEQERIVGVLEIWDDYLEKLERKIQLKTIEKNYLMRLFFGTRDFTPLKKLVASQKYAIVDGPFGSQMKISEFVESGIPVIEMHHLQNNVINNNKIERFITHKKFERDLQRSVVRSGDIVLSKTGSLGYVGLYKGPEAIITSRLAKVTIDQQKLDQLFIFEYFIFLQQLRHWERVGQGGTMKVLSIKNFEEMPVPNIEIDEQRRIGKIIQTISSEINGLKSKKRQVEQQKKFLLKNLVSGTIRTPEGILERSKA